MLFESKPKFFKWNHWPKHKFNWKISDSWRYYQKCCKCHKKETKEIKHEIELDKFFNFFHQFYKRTPEFCDLKNIIDIIDNYDSNCPEVPVSEDIEDYYIWLSNNFSKYEFLLSSKIPEILSSPNL